MAPSLSRVRSEAMPRKPADTEQITVRVERSWLAELDEIATALSRPGIELARADAIRAALARGIQVLRAELKLKSKR